MFPCVGSEQSNLEGTQEKEMRFYLKSGEWSAELVLFN